MVIEILKLYVLVELDKAQGTRQKQIQSLYYKVECRYR